MDFELINSDSDREFESPKTASLEEMSSKRNRELENFASLEPRVCEVLLYIGKISDQNWLFC